MAEWIGAGMTASASAVALIGASGAITGAVIGAIASWITAVVVHRYTAKEARDDRRRAAYTAFLGALDEILALYFRPGDLWQQLDTDPGLEKSVRQALSSIAHTSVAVLLTGSPEARNAVQGIDKARWGVVAALIDPAQHENLNTLMSQFIDVKSKIIDLGDELGEVSPRRRQSWSKIRRKLRPQIDTQQLVSQRPDETP